MQSKMAEGNVAQINLRKKKTLQEESDEEESDVQASYVAIESEDEEVDFAFNLIIKERSQDDVNDCLLTKSRKGGIDYVTNWIVDSSCSHHITGDITKFVKLQKYTGNDAIVTADNTVHPVKHVGDLRVITAKGNSHILEDVYHVPRMKKNLISVPQITDAGHYVLFGPDGVTVLANAKVRGDILMEVKKMKKLYVLYAGEAYVDKTRQHETADLWHARLAHVNYSRLDSMMKEESMLGLPNLETRSGGVCAGGQFGKAHKQPFGDSQLRTKLEKKTTRCIFVGYDQRKNGWKCMDPTTEKVYVSQDVVFDEA
ncbi:hypothetical protein AXG93_4360s1050 [Marchantia polymorpha subsp. ruderalis]|uniref:Uncharacterized protein n=1 Tax=Marchantia polymorpha subsp. ruderalis TaxID=1480154 RepID=A0A176W320_MARPO|nr:hypothetical protein AXG93_4360s1050 [Marchantia polymorpha subsp. ruderalis]